MDTSASNKKMPSNLSYNIFSGMLSPVQGWVNSFIYMSMEEKA